MGTCVTERDRSARARVWAEGRFIQGKQGRTPNGGLRTTEEGVVHSFYNMSTIPFVQAHALRSPINNGMVFL